MGYQLQYISTTDGTFDVTLAANVTFDSVIEQVFLSTAYTPNAILFGVDYADIKLCDSWDYNRDLYWFNGGRYNTTNNWTLNEVNTVSISTTAYYWNGVKVYEPITASCNIPSSPRFRTAVKGNLYQFTIKTNDVYDVNLVAWDEDGVLGMKDLVSGNFYTPATGTWTAGPAVHIFYPSNSSLKFPASGGSLTFDVEAETTWTASTPTFATLSPSTGGTGTTTVTATCPSYTGTTKREETITFTDNDSYTFDVKIRQRALTNGISNLYLGDNQIPTANAIYLGDAGVNTIYLGEEIVYSSGPFIGLKARPLSLPFSNSNLTNEITIQSSENWTITDDSTVGGYYTLENYTTGCDGWVPSYDGSLDGGEIDENGKWFEWQQGVSEITFQEYLDNLASNGITATGTACQNARYSVYLAPHSAGGPSWLSYSQTTGSTGKTVVTVTASTTQADRTATITVTSANYSATVSVSQQLIQFLDYIYVDQTRDRYCFIDTGIYPTTDTVATIKYKDMGIDNVCLYGFSISGPYGNDTPQVAPNDNSDYRFVSGKNYVGTIFDLNSSRFTYSNLSVDADGYANVTIGNYYVYDNVAQTSRGTGTTQSSIVTTTIPMYINISNIIRFNSAQIRQGNNLVFDGHAAYYNGVYGVYDNVSKQMLLPYIPTYPVVGGNYL